MALTEVNSLGIKNLEVKTADIAADAVDGSKIADESINSEHYVDGSIDHEHLAVDIVDGDIIADNAVGLAAMAGITRGSIIAGNASGDPAYLALGSNGQVLKSDGTDIAWAADAGGAALSNDANNRVVTADGSGGINGESGLTFDGTHLSVTDGDVVIATSGHGIDFSADGDSTNASGTASAHLLDDYEEGTFDPTCPTGVTSYNTRSGWYTKVGQVCHYQIYINMTLDSTSSTTDAKIEGLPFTSGAFDLSCAADIGWEYGLGTNVNHAYVNGSSVTIVLLGPMSGGERDHVSHNEVFQSRASARLCISGSYWTTA